MNHSGYLSNNQADKAIKLFQQTKNPNDVFYILFFKSCAQLGSNKELNLIKIAFDNLPKSYYANERILTSLIDALMKCGDTATAESVFNSIKNRTLSIVGAMMKSRTVTFLLLFC